MKLQAAFLCFFIGIISPIRAQPRLAYHIEVDARTPNVRITGTLEGNTDRRMVFFLPRHHGQSANTFIKNLAFYADGLQLEPVLDAQGNWIVDIAGTELTFSYELDTTASKQFAREPWGGSLSMIDEETAFLNGSMSFLVPARRDIAGNIELTWTLPPGWRLVTPWSFNRGTAARAPSVYSLIQNYYVAYEDGSSWSRRIGRIELGVLWLGDDDINDVQPALRAIERVIRTTVRLFGGSAATNRLILIFRDSNTHNLYRASTESSTIEFNFRAGTTFEAIWDKQQLAFLDLLAHEFLHTWDRREERHAPRYTDVPEWGDGTCWIREGFTEYFATLVLLEAGMIVPSAFVNALEAKSSSARKVTAHRTLSLKSACEDLTEDTGAWLYAYNEGASRAFLLDMELRRLTNGVQTLPMFMQAFYAEHRYREKSLRAFEAAWTSFAPAQLHAIGEIASDESPVNLAEYLMRLGVVQDAPSRGGSPVWQVPPHSPFVLYFK